MTQPYAAPTAPAPVTPRQAPRRLFAFFLSHFSAGAGQIYLGRVRRAVGWITLATLGLPTVGGILLAVRASGWVLFLALPVGAVGLLARPLSAFDAAFLRMPKDGLRPSALLVAVWFFVGLGLIIGSAAFTRRFLVEAFKTPSGSMVPTLLVGDHVFVDKTAKTFRRGHTVVFKFPEHPDQDFVKRVIAIGGDRLEMRNGEVWINGWTVPHCRVGHAKFASSDGDPALEGEVFVEFLDGEAYLTFRDGSQSWAPPSEGPWTIAPGEAFVLGDNRDNSHDSRRWFGGKGGGVPPQNVLGEPFLLWLSTGDGGDDGAMDSSRMGFTLDHPVLPKSLRQLKPALDQCMAARPAREATVPPPP